MTATDELRRLLDERGAKTYHEQNYITWRDANDYQCFAFETYERPGLLRVHCNLTPEQAIAATLGYELNPDGLPAGLTTSDNGSLLNWRGENYVRQFGGTLTAEKVMAIAGKHQHDYCSDTHVCFDWQAIADELNAELGRGTCEYAIKDNMNETEGMGDVWIECSACHCAFDYYADEWLMNMHYCPNCGARVERWEQ